MKFEKEKKHIYSRIDFYHEQEDDHCIDDPGYAACVMALVEIDKLAKMDELTKQLTRIANSLALTEDELYIINQQKRFSGSHRENILTVKRTNAYDLSNQPKSKKGGK